MPVSTLWAVLCYGYALLILEIVQDKSQRIYSVSLDDVSNVILSAPIEQLSGDPCRDEVPDKMLFWVVVRKWNSPNFAVSVVDRLAPACRTRS